jgi:hypothetical protein
MIARILSRHEPQMMTGDSITMVNTHIAAVIRMKAADQSLGRREAI